MEKYKTQKKITRNWEGEDGDRKNEQSEREGFLVQ